ncbi:MAG: HycG protein [Parcubacteria group bacterium GW2011_GWA2_47_7]|nr:MAG: HycG protein [Parcubacteria group bacterium GW2011_GWA2_47_7]
MLSLLQKVLSVPNSVISLSEIAGSPSILRAGASLAPGVQELFHRSLSIREVDAGSTAAEEEELKSLSNAYYDCERFGIHFVASPRHADMLVVTGPVTRNMEDALRRTYEATPEPKIVVAVGDGAIDGGIFKNSYAIIGGVDKVIPVNFYIPGNPPSPKAILRSLLEIMQVINKPVSM